MQNYTIFHLHSDLSNAFTIMDSVTKFHQYIDKAKELGMKAIAFSEHGNMLEWVKKKEYVESSGMKYIHAIETYVTINKDEKIRDNFHCVLIAKNWDGVQELLRMHSYKTSFNKDDGHNYYNPRITYDELKNTSDNIIICTACLGGILNGGSNEVKIDFINFLSNNKHRCFLEVQHHNVSDQSKYNNMLYKISNKYNIPLIAGTDTHYLNDFHAEGRVLLQKRKGIHFDNEDGWDLSMKSYDELVDAFSEQNSIPMEAYLIAIDNTNVMADMVEEFELDRSHKYPKLYNNSEEKMKEKIKEGSIKRNMPNSKEYFDRIKREFKVMKDGGSIDYILLEEMIKSNMAEKGIYPAPSRGSSSGSLINYLLGVTDIDSIKFNMIFERFLNPMRVSLCDIDSDWSPLDRPKVKEFIYSIPNLYCSEIVTFNTIALKGAIRDVGGAMDMDLDTVDYISKNVEEDEEKFREEYPELFKYVDLLNGVIVSVGSHPAATIVSPFPLDDQIGTFFLSTNDYPVSQINMKEVDGLNFVKLDILGLANIGVINMSCEMASIDRLDPNTIDFEDDNVWNHIVSNKNNIFQFESDFAHKYLSDCLRPEIIAKMKEKNPNLMRLDIMSMANGAIRPAGESYREALSNGEFRDNGHKALNDFLAPTNHFLVYQEQIIEFLNQFCGFSMGEADIVRRGFSKKTGTEEYIPKIKSGFINTMMEKHNTTKEEAEDIIDAFLVVIEDASRYLFSLNHATPYSIIGYMTAYMRYYYPLEFLCSSLIVNEGKQEKMAETIKYIKDFTDIKIEKIKFRKSQSDYSINKDDNTIYKGMSSIKYMNKQVSNELFELKDNTYNTFLDLLIDISSKTSINSRQLKILITLGFFSEFGKSKKLLTTYKLYDTLYNRKQIKKQDIETLGLEYALVDEYSSKETEKLFKELDMYGMLCKLQDDIKNEPLSLKERVSSEFEYMGYIDFTHEKAPSGLYYVIEFKTYKSKTKPYVEMYKIKDGTTIKAKITNSNVFIESPFECGSILLVNKLSKKPKLKKINGEWIKSKTEFNNIIDSYDVY